MRPVSAHVRYGGRRPSAPPERVCAFVHIHNRMFWRRESACGQVHGDVQAKTQGRRRWESIKHSPVKINSLCGVVLV